MRKCSTSAESISSFLNLHFSFIISHFSFKNLAVIQIFITFAPAFGRLSNGVMVAQQVLVLFVVVRIRLGQRNDPTIFMLSGRFVI